MSIYPDKKAGVVTGRWRVEVQHGALRKRGRFDTMAEAKDAEKRWKVDLKAGRTEAFEIRASHISHPESLSSLFAKGFPLLWPKGSPHAEDVERKIKWIIKSCGDIHLAKIPPDYVDGIVRKLQKADKASGTINRYLSPLHKLLAWAAKPARGYVPVMPEFSWQEEDEGRIRWLTPDEEHRLLATLRALGHDEIADLCIAAIDTGCRKGELLSAQPDQIQDKWLRLWKTKNGSARSVPLTERAQAILQARLPWTVKDYQVRYAWDKAKIAMGLSDDEEFVFHALRHSRASRLVEMGVNLRVIQQFMGHKVIQTTMRYAHVSDDLLAKTAAAIDSWNSLHLREPVGAGRGGPAGGAGGGHRQRTVLVPVE